MSLLPALHVSFLFFFNDPATTEIYTLSLHDALPICGARRQGADAGLRERRIEDRAARVLSHRRPAAALCARLVLERDRKSTRLNSSHANISYAVFCLKKKKNSMTEVLPPTYQERRIR